MDSTKPTPSQRGHRPLEGVGSGMSESPCNSRRRRMLPRLRRIRAGRITKAPLRLPITGRKAAQYNRVPRQPYRVCGTPTSQGVPSPPPLVPPACVIPTRLTEE
jgi:hypothetical protein